MKSFNILILLLLCFVVRVGAQQSILNKKVDFDYTEIPLEKVLKDLDNRYAIQFSYVNNMIPVEQKISAKAKNKPLKDGLTLILAQTDVDFTEVNGKVILRKNNKKAVVPKPVKASEEVKEDTRNAGTAEKKTVASTKPATVEEGSAARAEAQEDLNQAGALETTAHTNAEETAQNSAPASGQNPAPKQATSTEATIPSESKQEPEEELLAMNSKDSAVLVKKESKLQRFIKDVFEPNGEEKSNVATTDQNGHKEERTWGGLFKKKPSVSESEEGSQPHTEEAKQVRGERQKPEDREEAMPAHIGFTYPLSTNGIRAAEVANKISIHALIGVSKGIEGFEAAGIGSITKEYAEGGQLAGLFNIARDVKGVQAAGLTNITSGQVAGGQFAGLVNVGKGTVKGGSFAGLGNIQAAHVEGAQAAGLFNTAESIKGIQAAGIVNRLGDIKGVQVAGIINTAQNVEGAQVAGIINQARFVKGVQIGLINVADSVDGASIGLLSLVKKGYRRFEIYSSESFHANAAFKIGTQHFYTIFAGGAQFREARPVYGAGIGFGSQQNLSEQWKMSIDLTAYQVIEDWKLNYTSQNANLRLSFDREFGRYFTLFGGPSFNVLTSRKINRVETGPDFAPWNVFDRSYSTVNITMWPGLFAGFRF